MNGIFAGLLAVALAAGPAAGQVPREAGAGTLVLAERDAVRAALTRSPELKGAGYDVEAFLAKRQQADGARWPQLTSVSVIGPSPEADRREGGAVPVPLRSLNAREGTVNGAFGRVDLLLVQPLYTFGLIDNLRAAAGHGVRAQEAGRDKAAAEVALRVREAYAGLLLFEELRRVLGDLRGQLGRATERLEGLLDGGFASEQDVFKLRTYTGELERNLHLAERGGAIAAEALRVWTGAPAGTVIRLEERRLSGEARDVAPVETYVESARARRPEFVQLQEGLRAKRALVEAERARAWPMLFLGIQGSFAHATNRDRILDNAYVTDPMRHAYIGPVLGLKYDLDFGIASGRVREALAEVGKLEAQSAYAAEGIPLEVARAHGEVVEATRTVRALERAYDNAKKWVVSAVANFDLGVGDTRDLADAVLGLAKTRADYLQALFNYRVGVHRLDKAAGRDLDEIRAILAETAQSQTAEVVR